MQLQTAWQGLLPVYLFLGGLGGAVLLVAGALDAAGPKRCRRTVVPACLLALGCLVTGSLILLLDTGLPLRGIVLWRSFSNLGSWLSVGAWALVAAMTACVALGLTSFRRWGCAGAAGRWLRRALDAACALAGFSVCAYTGVLLMEATAVVSWGTALLPALFTASSLGTGTAAVGVLWRWRQKPKRARRMGSWSTAELGCIVAEAVLLALYVAWLAAGETTAPAAEMLLVGHRAPLFWLGVVACGLGVPFALSVAALMRRRHPKALVLASALCALAGNLALRFLVLVIGLRLPVVLL